MKAVSILGSTGSVGRQALAALRGQDDVRVLSLAAGTRWKEALTQAKEWDCEVLAIEDLSAAQNAEKNKAAFGLDGLKVLFGADGVARAATLDGLDTVLHAVPGFKGIRPLLESLEAKKTVAFAGKEALVSAGDLVKDFICGPHPKIIPVDSEHSAIFQCLRGEDRADIKEIVLTASGGSLWDHSSYEMASVGPSEVLAHPTWSMGPKITVDSATLFNKTLEVMEAHHLFGVDYDDIKVVVHRQSIVHSMVTFKDGSTLAQAAVADMALPILYGLFYPQRPPSAVDSLSPYMGTLTFQEADTERFPCLSLGYEAGEIGGTAPCVLSYADEILVGRFLRQEIGFMDIYPALKKILHMHEPKPVADLESLYEARKWVDSVIWEVMP